MVLSGGGVRGLAHVGVLQALGEEGIQPQVLSGTSSGAIVAALYAAGYSAPDMLGFFVRKNPFRLSKMALVKPGLFDTEKVAQDLLEYFPEDSFEALERRVFLTATDLISGQPRVFSSGPLVAPILASCSTPLVFTPTRVDGHWYSDGGITDNFPVEPLAGRCDVLLGVYVTPLRTIREKSLRTSLAVSQRAFEIGMFHNSERKFSQCDLVICPPELSRYGTFDTKHFGDIMEVGYRAAQAAMEGTRRLLERGRDRPGEPAPG